MQIRIHVWLRVAWLTAALSGWHLVAKSAEIDFGKDVLPES